MRTHGVQDQMEELTRSLSTAFHADVARFTEEDLLDLMVKKLDFAYVQEFARNSAEAEYTKSVAREISDLLKLRIEKLRNLPCG